MILRCTNKLLDELGIKKSEAMILADEIDPLDEWYAHIFYINRRKCIMFMNATTRFCFVEMDTVRERLKSFEEVFRKGLGRALYEEEYPAEIIRKYYDRVTLVRLAITRDRSVLGTINQFIKDFIYMYKYPRPGIKLDSEALRRQLRRIPVIKHGFPDQNMRELLSRRIKA